MSQQPYQPFSILKKIRDKEIKNLQDFEALYPPALSSSVDKNAQMIRNLEQRGLLKKLANGEYSLIKSVSLLFRALDVSLTKLSAYTPSSLVCTPVFGKPTRPHQPADIFVLMPFVDELQLVYEHHIKALVASLGFKCARGDDFFTSHAVITDIWNAINAARLIIADCTFTNPNVFYEIGIAHTLGKPVVCIAQDKQDIPFNIHYFRHIIYEDNPTGMQRFDQILQRTIKENLQ